METTVKYMENLLKSSLRFLAFLIFVVVFSSFTLFLIRELFETSLLFDQIVIALVISFFILITILRVITVRNTKVMFSPKDVAICLLVSFFLLTSTLLNIDRSRSFYILSWVNNGQIKVVGNEIDLSRVMSDEASSSDGIKQRIREQESRGIIVSEGSILKLSAIGTLIYNVSTKLARIFKLNGWFGNLK